MFVAVAPGAGITADLAVYLDSSSPFVNGTPFLEWSHHPAVGAAPALSSVPQHKLVMFLLRHDRLSEFLAIDVPSDRNVQAEFMDACVLLSGTDLMQYPSITLQAVPLRSSLQPRRRAVT